MGTKQKVFLISGWSDPEVKGGVSILNDLVSALLLHDRQPFVYTATPGNKNYLYHRSEPFHRWYFDGLCDFSSLFGELTRLVNDWMPDVIIANDLFSAFLGVYLRVVVTAPAVIIYHETPNPPTKIIGRLFNSASAERGWSSFIFSHLPYDLLLCPSNYFMEWALSCGAKESRTQRHYFGVDLAHFPYVGGVRQKGNIIFCPSRVIPRKRLEDLLMAIPRVLSAVPNAQFWFTWRTEDCPPEYESFLLSLIADLNIGSSIRLMKNIDRSEMPGLYAQAYVCILPSDIEGLGLTLIESQAVGTATIGTDVPGIREVIEDRKTGLLVPRRDPSALSEAILELFASPPLAEELAISAYARVKSVFDGKKNFAELVARIDSLTVNKTA